MWNSQGSVVDPLLFNIVINYLPLATKKFDFVMYVNDTTVENFGRTCNVKEIQPKVTTWLQRNKLRLNVPKSKFIMFLKHLKALPKLSIKANGNLIYQVSKFNFLDIACTFDERITWNPYIRSRSIKTARVIGILQKYHIA